MTATSPETMGFDGPGSQASADDLRLVAALRNGDEGAFVGLLEQYQTRLLRLAMLYVPSQAVAEEVVQDTWVGVLQGLARFEGRSSLKTWIFRILTNRARTRGERENRCVAFSALLSNEADVLSPTVDPEQFHPPDHPQWANIWVSYPHGWEGLPEDQSLSREMEAQIKRGIDGLPPLQREVITLRDVEGWEAAEVCTLLHITEANQRVLLHRARAKVRRVLDQYLYLE